MVSIDSHGILSIVEIAFYSPAVLASIAVCIKQGFSRNSGWLYLVLISILRLIGASCSLYIETKKDYSTSLQETVAITSSIGTAPLLLALLGFLERINDSMKSEGLPKKVFLPIHLVAIAALIVAIVGGVFAANTNSDHYDTGRDCTKAGAIIFVVVWVAVAGIALQIRSKHAYVPHSEKILLMAGLAAVPVLLVRVIYTVAVAFGSPGSVFYYKAPGIWVQTFMMFAMEALAVLLYIWAGLASPKQELAVPGSTIPRGHKDVEAAGTRYQETRYGSRRPRAHQSQSGNGRDQLPPQRSLGDYRPSRLIRSAISGRK